MDKIDGGAGTDKMVLTNTAGAIVIDASATIANVELLEVSSSVASFNLDTSVNFTGLTTTTVTGTAGGTVKGGTEALNVTNAGTNALTVQGGGSQTVTASGANVIVGGAAGVSTKGAITVTHSKLAADDILVDGGSTVAVTTAGGAATGTIEIGTTTKATGAVTVVAGGNAYTAAQTDALGTIKVTGGTSVSVTQTAFSATTAAVDDAAAGTRTQGAVTIDANGTATSVTVVQSAAQSAKNYVLGVTGVKEAQTVTFSAMAANATTTINGLTFTASKNLTALEVASAFANLAAGTVQGNSAASNGIYSGTFSTALANGANLSSGPAVAGATAASATVVFTEGTASTAAFTLAANGSASAGAALTSGVTAVTAVTGRAGIAGGAVTITDGGATDKLATVTLDGHGVASVTSTALSAVTLKNSDKNVTLTNATAANTLGLTVDNLGAVANPVVTLDAATTTVNLTVASESYVDLVATGLKNLTVVGSASADLSGGTHAALETITVSGDASVSVAAGASAALKTVTSTSTGSVTASVDGTKATVSLGAGDDSITTAVTTTISKAISLGAGADKLSLLTGTTAASAVLDGGDGTDTLTADAETLAALSLTTPFGSQITGFEKIEVSGGAATKTVNLANLDSATYVINNGGSAGTVAEVQNTALTGPATGPVSFLGSVVATSANADTAAQTVTKIVADKAAIIAAWNLANPTLEISDLAAGAGTSIDITYRTSEGDVAAYAGATSAGITFAAATTGTAGVFGGLVIDKMGANGTLEMSAASAAHNTTVTLADASGTADAFTIVTKVDDTSLDFGNVAVAGVETIKLTATDIDLSSASGVQTATIRLQDSALKTLTIDGSSNLTLTLDGSNAVTSVDASALVGKFTFTTLKAAAAATTVTGTSKADTLTASRNGDVLIGGEGADTLAVTGGAGLVTLTGGAGADIFNVGVATSNANNYATITDASAGDSIKFSSSAATFSSAKLLLAGTAVFQDYANEAVKTTDTGAVSWFTFGGDTYIVENKSDSTSFVNGTDIIVKLTGALDLSTASFSSSNDTALVI